MIKKFLKCMQVAIVKVDDSKFYSLLEAMELFKEIVIVKFDEMVEVYICLGIDFKYSD